MSGYLAMVLRRCADRLDGVPADRSLTVTNIYNFNGEPAGLTEGAGA